jgi:NADP-dependent 3-hydroxy acid dehydrogenase YdfG
MDTPNLRGTRAFVTGASRGIGRAAALALADAGADIALSARSEDDLHAVADEVRSRGREAAVCVADVTDRAAMEAAAAKAEAELGPVDILLANAGVAQGNGAVWRVDPEVWWRVQRVNVLGVLHTVRAVVPGMVARGAGRVILVGSYAAVRPQPESSAYGCSKASVLWLNQGLAEELDGTGVTTFAMSPGMVRTDMTRELIEDREIPEESLTDIAEGAGLIVRLASGAADDLSGRMIHVTDDLGAMIEAAAEIRERNWYQLRLVRGLRDTDPM